MKSTTIIVLAAVVLICLVAALLTSDVFTSTPPEKPAAEATALFTPAIGKVAKLTVQGPTGTLAFVRTDGKWRITEPIDAAADDFSVNQLVDAVKDIKATKAEDVDEKTTGLASPKWTVTITDDKVAAHKLLVGLPRPLQADQTYVRTADSKTAYIADVDLAAKLSKPVSDFRDMTVLDVPTTSITRVKLAGPESFELTKHDEQWQLDSPVATPANKENVQKLLDAVGRVTASDFVADNPKDLAPYGLATPRLLAQIEVAPEKPKTPATTEPATQPAPKPKVYTVALGKLIDDKIYAKVSNSPAVFQVNQSLLKDLQPKLVDLRVRKVLDIAKADVTGVDISVPAGKAGLAKVEGKWEMALPLKGPASGDAVDRLLTDAADLKAESFKDDVTNPGLYGLDKPAATITFRMAGKDRRVSLAIGAKSPSGEMTFVQSGSANSVAVVKTSDLTALLAEPATYWNETILKLPDGARAASLDIRRPDDNYSLVHDANDAWRLTSPAGLAGQ